ncbi:MAG: hypothetical protein LBG96_16615 [Tannerella sp.]|jgi:hypothetical protein|nr:hypothetical protein [Tannerella sp.]
MKTEKYQELYKKDYDAYKHGDRNLLAISLATRYDGMTGDDIEDLLTGAFNLTATTYRRLMRHPNAGAKLVKRLAADGKFLATKCDASRWCEATPAELDVAARWCVENDCTYVMAEFAEHPATSSKTLKCLYKNCEDRDWLWDILLNNPATPHDVVTDIEKRISMVMLNQKRRIKKRLTRPFNNKTKTIKS